MGDSDVDDLVAVAALPHCGHIQLQVWHPLAFIPCPQDESVRQPGWLGRPSLLGCPLEGPHGALHADVAFKRMTRQPQTAAREHGMQTRHHSCPRQHVNCHALTVVVSCQEYTARNNADESTTLG